MLAITHLIQVNIHKIIGNRVNLPRHLIVNKMIYFIVNNY